MMIMNAKMPVKTKPLEATGPPKQCLLFDLQNEHMNYIPANDDKTNRLASFSSQQYSK